MVELSKPISDQASPRTVLWMRLLDNIAELRNLNLSYALIPLVVSARSTHSELIDNR